MKSHCWTEQRSSIAISVYHTAGQNTLLYCWVWIAFFWATVLSLGPMEYNQEKQAYYQAYIQHPGACSQTRVIHLSSAENALNSCALALQAAKEKHVRVWHCFFHPSIACVIPQCSSLPILRASPELFLALGSAHISKAVQSWPEAGKSYNSSFKAALLENKLCGNWMGSPGVLSVDGCQPVQHGGLPH